ncbi:MAG: glycosyltransferase [Nitrospira sp.]|nr:glycosyltransferase [Nitrospira sp.]
MKPLTVLHTIETSGPGGAEKLLLSLIDQLDRSEFQSKACLIKSGWLREQLEARGCETFIVPSRHTFDLALLLRFRQEILERGVDIIHAHEFAMNTYGSLASVLTGVPCVATQHGKNYFWKKWRRRMAYKFVARQSALVAVSDNVRSFVSGNVGLSPDRIRMIYNGIDPRAHQPDDAVRLRIRAELSLSPSTLVIGTVGNLYPIKGQSFLIRAMPTIVRSCPTAVLLVAGRGELREALQAEADALGVSAHVRFLGYRDDVPTLLQGFDVFVLPSLSEGLPFSALEAMATGKPVVATRVGGTPEVIVDGTTGYLVPPEDSHELAEKILALLCDTSRARLFGQEGIRRVEKAFSLCVMVGQYQQLYRTLLGR